MISDTSTGLRWVASGEREGSAVLAHQERLGVLLQFKSKRAKSSFSVVFLQESRTQVLELQ